jgi:hypothetical protein
MGQERPLTGTRSNFRSDSFVRRIKEEKGLTVGEMSARSHLTRKTILTFLNHPFMTTGNKNVWFAAWARALSVTKELVFEEMEKLFAHRYFPCEFCKQETFRMQNHQRFCSNECRQKWRRETPKRYRGTNIHSLAFGTSYLRREERSFTERQAFCASRDFQQEIDDYLKEGGTVKTMAAGFVENPITIPREELEEKIGEQLEIRVEVV